MTLTKPALAEASPGAPITAQAWNDIVGGLGDLYDAVLAFGSAVVEVDVTFGDVPVNAVVVAEPSSADVTPVAALPPVGPRTSHLLAGLTPGDWTVRVESPGMVSQATAVTVPRTEPVKVLLEASGAQVPDIFGMGASAARGALNDAGIVTDRLRIIDTAGRELAPHDIPPEHANSAVLVQTPPAGSILASAAETVRLVIAAPLVQTETVTVPSLVGLTLSEASEALQAIGLTVGVTETRG